jgi:uncharacterized YigZ family protein
MLIDSYYTLTAPTTGEYKEKGSKFLAYAYPFEDESDLDAIMIELKTIHPKARHYCYGYKIGVDNNRHRANDDGEPSGTAGKPIYGQILSFGLTNVAIVVIRYFGGTKLGATGLIHAYKEATKEALEQATKVEKFISNQYQLTFGYDHMGHIMNAIKELDIHIVDKSFEAACNVSIALRLSQESDLLLHLKAKILQKSIEEVSESTQIAFCTIEKVI